MTPQQHQTEATAEQAAGQFLLFHLDQQLFALPAAAVNQVIRAVLPTVPLDAPQLLQGIVSIEGRPVPLINIRRQFGLPEREIQVSDRIILTESSGYPSGFVVDGITGVYPLQTRQSPDPKNIYPHMHQYVAGIARFDGHTVLIYDVDKLVPAQTVAHIHRTGEAGQ